MRACAHEPYWHSVLKGLVSQSTGLGAMRQAEAHWLGSLRRLLGSLETNLVQSEFV